MANKTALKKEKKKESKFKESRNFKSGDARAYLFSYLSKQSNYIAEFSELTHAPSRKYIYFWKTIMNTTAKSILVQLLYGEKIFINILKNQRQNVNSYRILQKQVQFKLAQKPCSRVGKRKYTVNGISTTLRPHFRWKLLAFSEVPGL